VVGGYATWEEVGVDVDRGDSFCVWLLVGHERGPDSE
jgi:hypothetical protein